MRSRVGSSKSWPGWSLLFVMKAYRGITFFTYGYLNFTRSAFLKHAKGFQEKEMEVDMTGRRCVVTGSNQGIGFASAEALAARGATVYLLCRNKERGEKAVENIRTKTGNPNVSLEVCDMSSLQQVKEFATRYTSSEQPLHVLVNNAGAAENDRILSVDGLEKNFAVNVAGVYAITELLMPALERASPDGRVITVSSGGMYAAPLTEDLQYEHEKKFDGMLAYAKNKRVQVALAEHWTEVYGPKGVGFYTMHPGWVDTEIIKRNMPSFYSTVQTSLRSSDQGADTIVWLALQPNSSLQNGAFYFDRAVAPKHLQGFRTEYTNEKVSALVSKIGSLCGLNHISKSQ
ncbi:unnamed protein product [Sphagnum troendelagicum]